MLPSQPIDWVGAIAAHRQIITSATLSARRCRETEALHAAIGQGMCQKPVDAGLGAVIGRQHKRGIEDDRRVRGFWALSGLGDVKLER